MMYHLGYCRLTEVAVEKASELCPDGNENVLSVVTGMRSPSYCIYGRGLFTMAFNPMVMPTVARRETPACAPE